MKIIRLTTFLDFGGVEKRLVNISHANDGNDWVFCAINKGGEAETKIREQGKKVISFNWAYKIPNLQTVYKLYTYFKKESPDVVHTSGAEANFHGVLAAKLARVPVVVSEEIGIPSQSRTAKSIFGLIYRLSDFVVGNSQPVIDYLKTENKVSKRKLKLIPNPMLFPELPQTEKTRSDVFRIVSVSRLEAVKNIESILKSVSRLVSENINVEYVIVGEGAQRSSLENLVAQLGIKDNVTFAGFQNNPYPFLQQSDLYVLSSYTEGFSNSLAEAMYSGTPSLSTKVGAAGDIIMDGHNGWLVEPNNDTDLFLKLKEVISFVEIQRNTVGHKGKKTILENYSLENHLTSLMNIYKN
ncbi:hypothetical protein FEDK69T_21340 [Flavobacterium enshiense DK69]|uniref:Glycosyl transferase family 1 n=1 Tax=Flavobacterium enshiense DK69 TaxID=1107311 RepID=V6S658_9FLAO|nr:glycosyltransferase [Flavobacterium enshiense]ESU22158.1 hypothetical protein FEDK69T_21340 [Flavobacterium enshiense DK69]KGO97168.1 hypothetical protein Q767_00760 [Flavobacterium enshiense DK69]